MSRHPKSWFSDQSNLWWLLGGGMLHMGLILAYMPLFVLGVYCLPTKVGSFSDAVIYFSLSVMIGVPFHVCGYYNALTVEYSYPFFNALSASLLWYFFWVPCSVVYIYCRQRSYFYLLPSIWLFSLGYIHEYASISLSHVSPLLSYSPWAPGIYWFGLSINFLFIWLTHLLRVPLIKHSLWFAPLWLASILPKQEITPMPKWIDEIKILPEGGIATDLSSNMVYSKKIFGDGVVYYASVGSGWVRGMSLKRHMVFLIESGYTPHDHSRILSYKNHNFLLLVCHDAMFSDVGKEVDQAEIIVVVSNLSDLNGTPAYYHFLKRLQYLSLYHHKPVLLVDYQKTVHFPYHDYKS